MKLLELLQKKEDLEEKLKEIGRSADNVRIGLQEVHESIATIIAEPVKQARQLADKTTGTVDVLVDGVMVKHQVGKTVKWDQEKLESIRAKIEGAADNPDKYMDSKTTYKVSEKMFKAFPPVIKKVFEPARSIVPGAPKITFNTDWR